MMYKYSRKLSKIKIFNLEKKRDLDGFVSTIKTYIHPTNSFINAYVRELSSDEKQKLGQAFDERVLEIVINKRNVTKDMLVDFKGQTFEIKGIDRIDEFSKEVKLKVALVKNEISFDKEEGSLWQ